MNEKLARDVEIGLIGGSGVYDPNLLKDSKEFKMHTPYGAPSDFITVGNFKGKKVAFIPRHGKCHTIMPSNVNSRANIWALKELGVKFIIGVGAVGSLKEEIKPGHMVFTNQFVDRTYRRETTFYPGPQVCHISVAEPICPELRVHFCKHAKKLRIPFKPKGTCVVIEGPRFSTKAESQLYRSGKADIIGMTLTPECVLAREAEICYVSIATVTDYDVWANKPVSADEVIATMKKNIENVKKLLEEAIPTIPKERICTCKDALKGAFI